jgi:SnoaL-like domain
MSDTDELREAVETLAARVRALADQVEIMQLVAQYGPAVDSGSGEAAAALWTEDDIAAMVYWRWLRTPQGWRIAERINANLDGTPEHRQMLAPPEGAGTTKAGLDLNLRKGSADCRNARITASPGE